MIPSMVDRPIIFSAPMVRALLEGRKTMTRRLAWKHQQTSAPATIWQKVWPADRLWVRENLKWSEFKQSWLYSADDAEVALDRDDPMIATMVSWAHHREQDHCPSIHMPRWASRLTLTVTATKVELLQAISEEDAVAEGAESRPYARLGFEDIWRALHGVGAWEADPEVVALTFSVAKTNIDRPPS